MRRSIYGYRTSLLLEIHAARQIHFSHSPCWCHVKEEAVFLSLVADSETPLCVEGKSRTPPSPSSFPRLPFCRESFYHQVSTLARCSNTIGRHAARSTSRRRVCRNIRGPKPPWRRRPETGQAIFQPTEGRWCPGTGSRRLQTCRGVPRGLPQSSSSNSSRVCSNFCRG